MVVNSMSYATYERYKDSGVDWLGEIPSDWELLKVKNIFRLVMKFAPKNNDCELLSVYTDIGVKPRKELEERGNRATTTDGYLIVEKGDIVVNKLLAWMGAIGLSDYDGVTSPAYDILKPKIPIEGIFYHLLFRSPQCTSELRRYSRGIMDMRLRLYFDKFGDVVVPYPNIEVQKKIVSFLAKKTTQIDQAIALKQQQIEKLGEYKQIVIQNAVTKGLNPNAPMKDSGVAWIGDIPEHWQMKRLKYVLDERNERSKTGEEPLFMVSQKYGLVVRADYHEKAEVAQSNIDNKIVYKNDLVFNKLKPHLGVFYKSEIDFKGLVSPDYAVYKVKNYIYDMKYLELLFRNPKYIEQFIIRATGIVEGLIRLYTASLFELPVMIPPKEEQKAILNFVKKENNKIDISQQNLEKQIDRLKEYKNILINQAVTGKIKI